MGHDAWYLGTDLGRQSDSLSTDSLTHTGRVKYLVLTAKASHPPEPQLCLHRGLQMCSLNAPAVSYGTWMYNEERTQQRRPGQNRHIWTRGRGSSEAPEVLESCLCRTDPSTSAGPSASLPAPAAGTHLDGVRQCHKAEKPTLGSVLQVWEVKKATKQGTGQEEALLFQGQDQTLCILLQQ